MKGEKEPPLPAADAASPWPLFENHERNKTGTAPMDKSAATWSMSGWNTTNLSIIYRRLQTTFQSNVYI